MSGESVLLIGSTGFIGSELYRKLSEEGYDVTGVSRKGDDVKLDITGDPDLGELPDANVVVYAAGLGNLRDTRDKKPVYDQVDDFLRSLADRYTGSKMVLFSSLAAIGLRNEYSKGVEPEPVMPFSRFKLRCERTVEEKFDDSLVVRPGFVYGEDRTHEFLEIASIGKFSAYVNSTTVAVSRDQLTEKVVDLIDTDGSGEVIIGREIEIRELAAKGGLEPVIPIPRSAVISVGILGSALRGMGLRVPGLEMARSVIEDDPLDTADID